MIRSGFLTLRALAAPGAAKDLSLILPIDCVLGDTCYVQQFVDRNAGSAHSDYNCSTLTYDGHKGTDFALPSLAAMTAGVDVLASATSDDMPDIIQGAVGASGKITSAVFPCRWQTQQRVKMDCRPLYGGRKTHARRC